MENSIYGSDKSSQHNACFKIILIGNSGVGKSCILIRYVDNSFSLSYITTIGIDFKIKKIIRGDKTIKLQIWDTAGQERFKTITSAYYRHVDAVIFIYDITDRNSFESVEEWSSSFVHDTHGCNVVKILVGNKMDNQICRTVSYEEGEMLANKMNMPFIECSAKLSNGNIHKIFDIVCDKLIPKFFSSSKKTETVTVGPEAKSFNKCC